MGREAFTERVWEWKQQYGSAITEQMKRLGASVDWSREYFTMDDRLSVAVKEAFVRLYEQGLIYRGAYIVNWDPSIQTAVCDLEVDSEERVGKLYTIRYPLADGTGSITIATTRPETMLGDVAVAVNPSDERYQHLIGKNAHSPSASDREIPIIADDWANPEFGTGAVKVTPAHDPNDFAIGQRHNLPNLTIFDPTAHVDLPGSPFHGLDRFEARERIVADLEAIGALVEIKDHPMTVPISQRTGAIIEPRLSMQWFIKIQPLADTAIAAVEQGHITFTPDNNRKTYMEWMTNIHDWCISRQLWWGHRIPAWHCNACGDITVSRDAVTACPAAASPTSARRPTSSTPGSPPACFPSPSSAGTARNDLTPDLAAFYPTQQLVTGFDILFFWVARMIMLSCHFMLDVPMPDGSPRTLADAVPFRNVYIHALVRDADRQKISKTKGNVIDPIEIVTKYGTDAVRFTLAAQASPGTDIAFNEARTEGYRAFANKIWNAARFLQMNIERGREAGYKVSLSGHDSVSLELPETTPLETRWIFSRLSDRLRQRRPLARRLPLRRGRQLRLPVLLGRVLRLVSRARQASPQFLPRRSGAASPRDITALTLNALVSRLRGRAAPALALHALPHRRALACALRQRRHRIARKIHRPHPLSAARRLRRRRSLRARHDHAARPHRHHPRPAQRAWRTRKGSHADPASRQCRRSSRSRNPTPTCSPAWRASARSSSLQQPSPATTPAPPPPSMSPSSTSARSTFPPSASASPRTSPNSPRALKPPTSSSATKASSPAPPHTSSKACASNTPKPSPSNKKPRPLSPHCRRSSFQNLLARVQPSVERVSRSVAHNRSP